MDKISKFDCEIDSKLIEDNFGIISDTKLKELYDYIKDGNIDFINNKLDEISNSGITPLNFVNDFVNYLLKQIIEKNIIKYDEIEYVKLIINKLNSVVNNFNSLINPFILVKIELLTLNYFPGNNNVNISQSKENVKVKKDIKNNKKMENFITNHDNIDNVNINSDKNEKKIEDVKYIRINNSFVDASKDYKINFKNNWNKLLNDLNFENDYSLLGYIETANVEVVSSTNVIFSFKSDNEAILFNNNIETIEVKYNEANNSNYKFIALSINEWNVEKQKFIDNKNKVYKYLDENDIINNESDSNSKAKNIADDLFGDNIVEIS